MFELELKYIVDCTHRSAVLCQHKKGNYASFNCPFHGWTFNNKGKLLNVKGRAPAPEEVVEALAAQSGEVVTPHGASAANALGLTHQVPIREVYLTTGRTRKLRLGRSKVLVKHVPRWMLALGTRPAGAEGGTSLSKAYKIMDRFSEDIDFTCETTLVTTPASVTEE